MESDSRGKRSNFKQRNLCNTKIESRQYNLAIIITVDTLRSSAGRAYFEVVNYQTFACDHRKGPFGDSAGQITSKSFTELARVG